MENNSHLAVFVLNVMFRFLMSAYYSVQGNLSRSATVKDITNKKYVATVVG